MCDPFNSFPVSAQHVPIRFDNVYHPVTQHSIPYTPTTTRENTLIWLSLSLQHLIESRGWKTAIFRIDLVQREEEDLDLNLKPITVSEERISERRTFTLVVKWIK